MILWKPVMDVALFVFDDGLTFISSWTLSFPLFFADVKDAPRCDRAPN